MTNRLDQLDTVLNNINKLSEMIINLQSEIKNVIEDNDKHKNQMDKNNRMKNEIISMKEYAELIKEYSDLKIKILDCELECKTKEDEVYKKYHIVSQKEVTEARIAEQLSNLPVKSTNKYSVPDAPKPPGVTEVSTKIVSRPLGSKDKGKGMKSSDFSSSSSNNGGGGGHTVLQQELLSRIVARRQSVNPTD